MSIFDILAIILIIGWLGGLTLHLLGGFIHILLVLAIVSFLLRFFRSTV